jgi:hypothetical protein
MQNCLISVWRKMVQVVIKVMYLPGSWERWDMLPQNTLQQVTFVTCIYSALYYSHKGTD